MIGRTILNLVLLLCVLSSSSSLDLTLEHHGSDTYDASKSRHVCGVVLCTEKLAQVDLSGDQNNQSRQLTSFSIYKNRYSGDTSSRHWQQVATLTAQQPRLNRVSDGVMITGQLSDQQATLSLELVKTHDCLQSQFSCVVVTTDTQGRTSVKKSLVGETLNSQAEFGPQLRPVKGSVSSASSSTTQGQFNPAGAWTQMMSFFQAQLDRMESSLRTLETRLEDKVEDSRAEVLGKVGALDNNIETRFGNLGLRMNTLENRLEDKLVHLDSRITEVFDQTKRTDSENIGICDRLTLKVDALGAKQDDNQKRLNSYVDKTRNLSIVYENQDKQFSHQINTCITSMQLIERNLTNFDDHMEKLETAANKCAIATSGQHNRLDNLVSSFSNLSGLTQDLLYSFNTFSSRYAGGALVPAKEYYDLLGTGKKEWRLAFRGTPYINVQVYPAYIHGTGIPVEVEEGCKQFNRSLPCANHYRNRDVFDNWDNIDEVLFGVYKNDQMVHRVIFNGKNTKHTNWFEEGRIIDSSWNDLTTQPHNYFSITGDFSSTTHRRFDMSRNHDGGCNGFNGWFMAGDTKQGCAVEKTVSFPTFFYATGNTFTVWASLNTGRADALGIFIKYE